MAYKTPNEPFQVWQIDLFGPVKMSVNGNQFIFTAIDMFSEYLFALPLRNKDMITVSNAIFQLVSQFGVCDTIISDQERNILVSALEKLADSPPFSVLLL